MPRVAPLGLPLGPSRVRERRSRRHSLWLRKLGSSHWCASKACRRRYAIADRRGHCASCLSSWWSQQRKRRPPLLPMLQTTSQRGSVFSFFLLSGGSGCSQAANSRLFVCAFEQLSCISKGTYSKRCLDCAIGIPLPPPPNSLQSPVEVQCVVVARHAHPSARGKPDRTTLQRSARCGQKAHGATA